MTDDERRPVTLREEVDTLSGRLSRIGAAAVTLRGLGPALRPGDAPGTLLALLRDLERDLQLASREVARVRAEATGATERRT